MLKKSVVGALHSLCTITVQDRWRSNERNANEEIERNKTGTGTSRQAYSPRLDGGDATNAIAESVAKTVARAARRGTDPLPRL